MTKSEVCFSATYEDSHGDVSTDNSLDWYKPVMFKWGFDPRCASSLTLTQIVGDHYVLSFAYHQPWGRVDPIVMQIKREQV